MHLIQKNLLALLSTSSLMFGLEIPTNHIVSTDWLETHKNDTQLVIIDTRKPEMYIKAHIKGSINYPKKTFFQGKLGNIPKQPNTLEQMQEIFRQAGVTQKSVILFYSAGKNSKDFADAASGIWNSWLYGIQNTLLLNGGYAKWVFEQKKVTAAIPKVTRSEIELVHYDRNIIASLPDIVNAVHREDIQITDARVNKFYKGEDKRKDLERHGRIPTAKLTPMIRYTKNHGSYFSLVPTKEAKQILYNNGYGVALDKPLNIYCNTGHKARGLWFVAKFLAGMQAVRVYDGSMVEYSRTNLPIETGEPMD